MGHVGPLPADQSPELTIRRGVPNRVFRQGQTVHVLDLVVVHLATHHAVASGLQESGFVHEDLVLAAGSLVPVVDRQDLHRAQITILAILVGVPDYPETDLLRWVGGSQERPKTSPLGDLPTVAGLLGCPQLKTKLPDG